MIRYLITDGTAKTDPARWIHHLRGWLQQGIEFVQIRERELNARELAGFVRDVTGLPNPHGARILVNDRADIALACSADGVHLRDGGLAPQQLAGLGLFVSISCHSAQGALATRGADLILLAPIFVPLSKAAWQEPLGLQELSKASRLAATPVVALGGITALNTGLCVSAGAAGVAGISLFS